MKISNFNWEKGWQWDCSRMQRLARFIEVNIAIDIWREYRYG